MTLTGFADEAGRDLATQIKATQELGWDYISARGIDGRNIHDLSDAEFDNAEAQLKDAGIRIAEFGSLIGTWAKSIHTDFDITLAEVERCIPRMKRLGTEIVRVMSYAQEPWGQDQHEQERFRRLREITQRFTDAGLITAHENCMNWGGFSADHTLRLIEEVRRSATAARSEWHDAAAFDAVLEFDNAHVRTAHHRESLRTHDGDLRR